jgi:hypothetical protein
VLNLSNVDYISTSRQPKYNGHAILCDAGLWLSPERNQTRSFLYRVHTELNNLYLYWYYNGDDPLGHPRVTVARQADWALFTLGLNLAKSTSLTTRKKR